MTTRTKPKNDELLRRQTRARLELSRHDIAAICHRYGVSRLSVFGSLTRAGEFDADSDIDLLVEFLPDVRHGWEFFSMQEELECLLGRKVDLNTAGWLSRHFRDEVIENAEPIYAAL